MSQCSLPYLLCKIIQTRTWVLAQLTLPNDDDAPAPRNQFRLIARIAGTVSFQFLAPALAVLIRQFEIRASRMGVPEASVNEKSNIPGGENEIGPPRQVATMKAKSQSSAMQAAPDDHLGPRIFALDRCHVAAAGRFVVNVSQRQREVCLCGALLQCAGP